MSLPLNALLMAIFVAWMMSRQAVVRDPSMPDRVQFRVWQIAERYLVPVAILAVLITAIRNSLGVRKRGT